MWTRGKSFLSLMLACTASFLFSALAVAQDANRTGITDTTIKIGMFAPLTGSMSAWGYPVIHGARAVFEEANEKGGIHGRKIVIEEEDDGCDPAKAVAAVKKLIHQHKVFMLNGSVCSAAAPPTLDEVMANGVPYMVLAATLDSMVKPLKKWVFRAMLSASSDGVLLAEFIKSNPNVKRIAVVVHPDEWGRTKLNPLIEGLKGTGITIVANETMERSQADATAQVLKMKGANPDAIVLITLPPETATVLRTSLTHGLRKPMLVNSGSGDLQDLLKKAGARPAMDNLYAIGLYKGQLDSPAMKPEVDRLLKYYPKDRVQLSSFFGTVGALAIVEGLRRAGRNLTRERLVEALETIKDLDGGPMACRVNFSPESHEGCAIGTMITLSPGTDKVVTYGRVWKQ